ncbi:MAG: hypothetical protein WBF90_31065 [Rivularia sp. (in: cyanobacteria)]
MKKKQRVPQKVKPPASKSESQQNISILNSSAKKTQNNSKKSSVPDKKNQELKKYQMEATKLKIQQKHGTLNSQGQKQLALLQAKINALQGKAAGESNSENKSLTEKNSENISEKTVNSDEKVVQREKVEDKDKTAKDKKEKPNQQVVSPEEKAAELKKQKFLEKYPVAEKLVAGIDRKSKQSQILKQLLENFKNIGFKYKTKKESHSMDDKDKSYEKLLSGNLEGDCRTLALAFKAVAEGYFDIKGMQVDNESSIKQPFLTEGDKIIDSSVEPNCDGGQKWFFQNHYWAVWNGQVFDVLFMREQETKADMVSQSQSLKSSLMPEQQYYKTDSGKIVYPNQGKYLTAELKTFEKLTSLIEDISKNSPRELDNIVVQIKSLYAKGGDINSDVETLIQDFEKKRVNKASLNKKNNAAL